MKDREPRYSNKAKIAGAFGAFALGVGTLLTACGDNREQNSTVAPNPNPIAGSANSTFEKMGSIERIYDSDPIINVYKMTDKKTGQVCYVAFNSRPWNAVPSLFCLPTVK